MTTIHQLHKLFAATILASALASGCSRPENPQGQGFPPALVELQTVENTTVQDSSEYVGALEATERVELRPEIQGRVTAILVSSGANVSRGTPIVRLRADANEAEVTGATADVAEARAAVNTARARVSAAEAARDRAASEVTLQSTEFQRTSQLVREGAQSRQELDRARNNRDTAIATLRAETEAVDVARAELAEATARLERSQADRSIASTNLSDSQVAAPITGVVSNIPVQVGDVVTPQTVLTSIIQNQALDLNIAVPIERTERLRVGLPVELLNQEGKPLVVGQISFVSPEVNTAEQSVLAKATFPNNGSLRNGQFVRARIIWQQGAGITVPTVAVTRIAGQPFVFVAEAGEPTPTGEASLVAKQRQVSLGSIQGNNYKVLSGLEPGDRLITSGVISLTDGAPIRTGPPEPPPGGQP